MGMSFVQSMRFTKKWIAKNNLDILNEDHTRRRIQYLVQDPIVGQTTLVTSNLDRQGKINKVEYFAIGKDSVLVNVNARNTQVSDFTSGGNTFNTLYIQVDTSNAKRFLRATWGGVATTVIEPGNIQQIANQLDDLPGVAPGQFSTYISLNGDFHVFA